MDWIMAGITGEQHPPKFLLIWLSGISLGIYVVESTYFRLEGYSDSFREWGMLWSFLLLVGLVVGGIGYYLKGALFWIGVKLAGGKATYRQARTGMLYAGLPVYFAAVFIEIVNTVTYWNEYFLGVTYLWMDLFWLLLKGLASVGCLFILVKVAIVQFQARNVRTIVLLCIIPILYYIVAIIPDPRYADEWIKLHKILPLYI